MGDIYKDNREQYDIVFDFKSFKPCWEKGEWIPKSKITVEAIDLTDDSDASNVILDHSKEIRRNNFVSLWLRGGEIGHKYKITCRAMAIKGTACELNCSVLVKGK